MMSEQKIQLIGISLIALFLFYILSPILGPFIFSALLAYLGDPLADRLEKRMSRTMSVVTVYSVIIITLVLVVMVFIPLISSQIEKLTQKLPATFNFIQSNVLPFLEEKLDLNISVEKDMILGTVKSHLNNIPSLASKLLQWFTGSADWMFAVIANIFLVPVVTFYLLRDWDILVEKVQSLIPRKHESKVRKIASESDSMLSAFLRGQFLVMNALGLIYAIGLYIVGIDFAILIGFIAGWLSFVPYLGMVIGMGIATVMAYFQFNDLWHPLGVVITFFIAQALEGSVLTPKFVGEKIGLHPVAVIFAILAGGQLAGFAGILLALPAAAVINVLISHAQVAYQQSKLYNS